VEYEVRDWPVYEVKMARSQQTEDDGGVIACKIAMPKVRHRRLKQKRTDRGRGLA
jgi:hypothetical protein